MLANYNAKISDIEEKYFTTLDYKKCTWHTWGKSKKKKKKLVNECTISDFVKNSYNHKTCNISNKSRIKSSAR